MSECNQFSRHVYFNIYADALQYQYLSKNEIQKKIYVYIILKYF